MMPHIVLLLRALRFRRELRVVPVRRNPADGEMWMIGRADEGFEAFPLGGFLFLINATQKRYESLRPESHS